MDCTAKNGWDPEGIAGMLTTLARIDEGASGSRRRWPNWLSTHPAPADRVQQVHASVESEGSAPRGQFARNEDGFLNRIDGIVYGDSPEQGVVRGNRFLHGDLRFAIEFLGRASSERVSQVAAKAPREEAYMVLQLVQQPRGSLEDTGAREYAQGAGLRLGRRPGGRLGQAGLCGERIRERSRV